MGLSIPCWIAQSSFETEPLDVNWILKVGSGLWWL